MTEAIWLALIVQGTAILIAAGAGIRFLIQRRDTRLNEERERKRQEREEREAMKTVTRLEAEIAGQDATIAAQQATIATLTQAVVDALHDRREAKE